MTGVRYLVRSEQFPEQTHAFCTSTRADQHHCVVVKPAGTYGLG